MSHTSAPDQLLDDLTVNEVIRKFPATVETFNDFVIDACCGGATLVREAAQRDGADPEALLQALERAIGGNP